MRERAVQEHRDSQYFRDRFIVTERIYFALDGRPKYSVKL